MDRLPIAASLLAMARRRERYADEYLEEAIDAASASLDAQTAAHATRDPEALRALCRAATSLRAASWALRGAAILLRLHGWVEETLAELLG